MDAPPPLPRDAILAAPVVISRVVTPPPRRGWYTSEFWVTLGVVAGAIMHVVPPTWSFPIAILTAAYNLSRGLAKR